MPQLFHVTGDPLDLRTRPTVPKAVALAEAAAGGALTLADRRLFDTLLANAYESLDREVEHAIALCDLRRLAARDDASPHKHNGRILASLERLQTVTLEVRPDHRVGLIGDARLSQDRRLLHYSFPPALCPLLVDPKPHARLRLAVVYALRSKHALVLYEALQRHADRRRPATPGKTIWTWTVGIGELRRLLGLVGRMTNFADLDRRVLAPAVVDIATHADFTVTYRPIRRGRAKRGPAGTVERIAFSVATRVAALPDRPASVRTRP